MPQTMQPFDTTDGVLNHHPYGRNRLIDQLLSSTPLGLARLFSGLAHQPIGKREGLRIGQRLVMDIAFIRPTQKMHVAHIVTQDLILARMTLRFS